MKAEEFYKQRSNSIRELWVLSPKQIEYIALIMEEYAALRQPHVSERYLLIEWIQGHPVIDGAKYADTKQELMDYYDSLPKLPKSLVEYTICRIYSVR